MANKFYESEMTAINTQISTLTQLAAAGKSNTDAYRAERYTLNLHLIQVLAGCTVVDKNGNRKVKFNKPLPTKDQVANIAKTLQIFINAVENKDAVDDDDDMAIPTGSGIGEIEKCNGKKLAAAILGKESTPMFTLPIDGVDCMKIAAFGEEARKKKNTTIALIIAGAVVVAAVGTTVAVIVIKKKKEDEDQIEDYIEEDIDEVPEVSVDSFRTDADILAKFDSIEATF